MPLMKGHLILFQNIGGCNIRVKASFLGKYSDFFLLSSHFASEWSNLYQGWVLSYKLCGFDWLLGSSEAGIV